MITVTEMRGLLGVSRAAFSRIYKIPIRTLEDWESGCRKCPDYVMYLLERAVKEDAANQENLLNISIDRQIEEMNKLHKTEDEIINNRFL